MLHKVYDIELPYEKLGLKTPDKKATITIIYQGNVSGLSGFI